MASDEVLDSSHPELNADIDDSTDTSSDSASTQSLLDIASYQATRNYDKPRYFGVPSDEPESWQSNEYPPLDIDHEALKHVAGRYVPGDHGQCVNISNMSRGSFHEIRLLEFEDGWSCIARFTRDRDEHRQIVESEVATLKYVRKHTSIPVPEIYFVDSEPANAVGAPFVLVERMVGQGLYKIWDLLTTEQKLDVVKQMAGVLAQLASLRFDSIGCIDANGEVGPLHDIGSPGSSRRGPFRSIKDFMFSCLRVKDTATTDTESLLGRVRNVIHKDLADHSLDALYSPPFRLIHRDFDAQNMLFTWPDHSQPPTLSGIIDWDHSFVGPLYYLYEYPIFIQDTDCPEERIQLYAENKILRKHFIKCIAESFPKGSVDRKAAREVFRQKSYAYNAFDDIFMNWRNRLEGPEEESVKEYADGIEGVGDYLWPYIGKDGWEADSDDESVDE